MSESRVLVNGEFTQHLSVLDRGLHYGDGLFETIRVIKGKLWLEAYHWQRLQQGCQRLNIVYPEIIAQEARTLITATDGILKVIVTRGIGNRGYKTSASIPSRILLYYPQQNFQALGYIKVQLCQTILAANPLLAGLKHLNKLDYVLARNEWQDDSINEGLLLNNEGHIIEGTMTNVFLVKDGQLFTPNLTKSGVAGVMRRYIMELAQQWQLPCQESEITFNELLTAQEWFMCNSIVGVWPVTQCQHYHWPIGPITQRIKTQIEFTVEQLANA